MSNSAITGVGVDCAGAVGILVYDGATDLETGDGKAYFNVPSKMNGMNLISCYAEVITAGTTNTTDIQIHNVTDAVDMLTTEITIDSGGTNSDAASTPYVIDTGNDNVVTKDLIRLDIDQISTTAPKGLIVTLEFK